MQKNIVVLGAGFGGLRCGFQLSHTFARDSSLRLHSAQNDSGEEWRIILVDRNPYHLYYPRLYEAAMPQEIKNKQQETSCTIAVNDILKGTRVEFVQGEVKGVDCKQHQVVISKEPKAIEKSHTAPMESARQAEDVRFLANTRNDENFLLSFDYLVLALGAGTDYFGIEGLEKYACTLKSLEDAKRIRERVGEFLQNPHLISPLERGRKRGFSVVIGGAGATGVEVAAELAYLFRKVPREMWSVTLAEALSSVLWMFPPEVGRYTQERLRELGVRIMLDTCIKRVTKGYKGLQGVTSVLLAPRPLKSDESEAQLACDFLPEHEKMVRADLLLWAGGVRANPLISQCGIPTDRKGRVEVDEYLQVKGLASMFAIGDNAAIIDPRTKQLVPATAQAALEQGKLVAENIGRLIKSRGLASGASKARPLASYRFHDFPAIIPLGRRDAVALVGGYTIRGWPAWLLRQAADLRYYCSLLPWWKAVQRCFSL